MFHLVFRVFLGLQHLCVTTHSRYFSLRKQYKSPSVPTTNQRFVFFHTEEAVFTGVVPFCPRFLPSIFTAHRVQQSHCSSSFHRVTLLTHALAFSESQFVHKKSSCAQEKFPTNSYDEYALGGFRTHETNLYQARG